MSSQELSSTGKAHQTQERKGTLSQQLERDSHLKNRLLPTELEQVDFPGTVDSLVGFPCTEE